VTEAGDGEVKAILDYIVRPHVKIKLQNHNTFVKSGVLKLIAILLLTKFQMLFGLH
jgi:hypothetical protein